MRLCTLSSPPPLSQGTQRCSASFAMHKTLHIHTDRGERREAQHNRNCRQNGNYYSIILALFSGLPTVQFLIASIFEQWSQSKTGQWEDLESKLASSWDKPKLTKHSICTVTSIYTCTMQSCTYVFEDKFIEGCSQQFSVR